jgi:hypothetical protein
MSVCAVGDARRMIGSVEQRRVVERMAALVPAPEGSAGVRAYVMDVDKFDTASSVGDRLRP